MYRYSLYNKGLFYIMKYIFSTFNQEVIVLVEADRPEKGAEKIHNIINLNEFFFTQGKRSYLCKKIDEYLLDDFRVYELKAT
tara:strand:- start:87 stop:332 length:246 start_codon:yes stop_codon:yes gene_type:complete